MSKRLGMIKVAVISTFSLIATMTVPLYPAAAQTFAGYNDCFRHFCPDTSDASANSRCMALCNDYFGISGGNNGASEGGTVSDPNVYKGGTYPWQQCYGSFNTGCNIDVRPE